MPSPEPAMVFSTVHLFVYGSLVDPRCLDDVLGHRHTGERLRARLDGFQRVETAASDYPFAVAAVGEFIDGILIMDLTPSDLAVLDRYEEVDSGTYTRIPVDVEAWGCGPHTMHVAAQTYVAGPQLRQLAVAASARSAPSTAS